MIAARGKVYDIQCKNCGIVYQIIADSDDVQQWQDGEGYIQDLLSYLSAAEREMMISGICDNCWKEMFGEDS